MACTPKPMRRQNKLLISQMRKHQRQCPEEAVVLIDESWIVFNSYRSALLEKMKRESRGRDDTQLFRQALSPVVQRLADLR